MMEEYEENKPSTEDIATDKILARLCRSVRYLESNLGIEVVMKREIIKIYTEHFMQVASRPVYTRLRIREDEVIAAELTTGEGE